jgi:hypothetical protein
MQAGVTELATKHWKVKAAFLVVAAVIELWGLFFLVTREHRE